MSPLIRYQQKAFRQASLDVIDRANQIIDEYALQGFDLTLRQLYYQFVSRDWIRNRDSEYKKLGSIVNDARMAGLIDWHSIVDRTRNLRSLGTWDSPTDIIEAAADSYMIDRWADQPDYVEVWIEKDALVGVIERPCNLMRVPFFSCRGYASQSEMWSAAQRLAGKITAGHKVTVLHLGDHDPSGIDMSRDIRDRLSLFIRGDRQINHGDSPTEAHINVKSMFEVKRIALNMDQVDQYGPPPNPAKLTDSRGADYVERYGYESWELDALSPTTLAELIDGELDDILDHDAWAGSRERENTEKNQLAAVVAKWDQIVEELDQ